MNSITTKCSRCGHPLQQEARFCSNCGHPAERPTESDTQRHLRLAGSAPASVVEKLRTSLLKGERRPVTALFADVVGSTAILERVDPEIWTDVLNEAFELMSRAVYRYEGTIAHLLGDGLLAFFGSPIAHEDDPERAVRAALEILESMRGFSSQLTAELGVDFQIRIGVNTGTVVVGDVGSDLRYEYTAIGDAVNVAARLQGAAAPGTILVTDPTYRFIAPKFETRYVGPLSLKGKAEPVTGYEVIGLKAAPGSTRGLPGITSSLVGRSGPLTELKELLQDVTESGRGAGVLILGEPGLGKTRLLRELRAATAERGDIAWAEGQCLSFGRGMPYHLLLDLLRSLLGVSSSSTPGQLAIALEAALRSLESGRAEVYRYLARLLGIDSDEGGSDQWELLPEEVRHERLIASLKTFLAQVVGPRAHVLVCEDVHWVDRSSAEVFGHLLEEIAHLPVLAILTTRPDPDAPIDELADAATAALGDRFRTIRLEPLSQQESRTLVAELLEIESLPLSARELILEKSEGNPLFVEEIIRMLMEQNVIVRTGDRWVANQRAVWRELPTTLHGLLLARVDRLPEEPKRVARVASVIGRSFDLETISGVLSAANGQVDVRQSLEALSSFNLVQPPGSAESLYSFRHALIEEAVYDSILHRDRSRLHSAVALVLERLHAGRLNEWAAVLARHLEAAGEVARSIDYLIIAGQNALGRFAPREAADLFRRALDHLSPLPRTPENLRLRLSAGLGRTLAGMSFIPGNEQLSELDDLLADAEELGDPKLLAEVHLAVVEVRNALGEIPAVSPALARSLEEAERIAELLNDDRLRAFPVALRGISHYTASEFRRAVEVLKEAVPLVERHSTFSKAAFYAGILAVSAARLGEFDLADEWIRRGIELAGKSQDPNAMLDIDLHHGIVEGERGNLAEGLAFVKRGTDTAVQIDNKACALVGYFIMGDQQMKLGLREDAARSLQQSTEIAGFCNVADIENLSRAWLSAVRAELGEEEEVLPRLNSSLQIARRMGDRLNEGEILRQRAIAQARTGDGSDWDAIREDFERAIAILEDIEARPSAARALRDYGITLEAAGRVGEGQEKLQRALALFQAMGIRQTGIASG